MDSQQMFGIAKYLNESSTYTIPYRAPYKANKFENRK